MLPRHGWTRSIACLLLPACLVLAAPHAHATTVRQLDTRELTLDSQDIVIGAVEDTRSYWDASHRKILTEVSVRVSRTLKGVAAAHLTLIQLGGEVDGVRYTIPGCPTFKAGEEALFFVWRDAKGRAQVNGLAQGKFDIRRDPATGERTAQRGVAGLAVRDPRTLSLVPAGQSAPRITLDELVSEIERTLASGDGR